MFSTWLPQMPALRWLDRMDLDLDTFLAAIAALAREQLESACADLQAQRDDAESLVGWWKATSRCDAVLRRTHRSRSASAAGWRAVAAVHAVAEREAISADAAEPCCDLARSVARALVIMDTDAGPARHFVGVWERLVEPCPPPQPFPISA